MPSERVRSAIVFGGARGIGRAVAEAFVLDNFRVTVAARTGEQVEGAVEYLGAGRTARGFIADVAEFRRVREVIDAHVRWAGSPDAVVNTAAVQGPVGYLWQNEPEQWRSTVLTNLFGSFNVCRAALPVMREEGRGVLVLFSGGGAACARPRFSAYGAAKTGVVRLVETLHEEIMEKEREGGFWGGASAPAAVRVYAVAPGAVRTRMTEEVLSNRLLAGEKAYREALRTMREGGVSARKAAMLCLFLATVRPFCLSGKLIHVNEPYQEYVAGAGPVPSDRETVESGLLRRVPFRHD